MEFFCEFSGQADEWLASHGAEAALVMKANWRSGAQSALDRFQGTCCTRPWLLTSHFVLPSTLALSYQAREGGQMTATTTKTANVHGDELIVTTTSPYEQVGGMAESMLRFEQV
jgi:hypothetical protein